MGVGNRTYAPIENATPTLKYIYNKNKNFKKY